MTTQTTDFWRLFKPPACAVDLKANEFPAVFEEIVGNMIRAKVLEPGLESAAVRTLVEREKLASTGVGMTVAIPHVAVDGVESVALSVSVSNSGIDWAAIDGEPVHVVFTVLRPSADTPDHDADRHLEMMRWISRLARHEDFRRFAVAARTRTELVDLLKEMSGV
ncbi:MAG: PTS sugar transporter subunit IIA [Planctomycetota bacterium]